MTDREYMEWQQKQLAEAAAREIQLRAELNSARLALSLMKRDRDRVRGWSNNPDPLGLANPAVPSRAEFNEKRTQADVGLDLHCGVS